MLDRDEDLNANWTNGTNCANKKNLKNYHGLLGLADDTDEIILLMIFGFVFFSFFFRVIYVQEKEIGLGMNGECDRWIGDKGIGERGGIWN
jgi:hypothetical protein